MVCHRLEVEYPMPPSPGVRPDLATRLRQSQRALESRLGKPDTHLSLMRAAHATLDPEQIGELVVDQALEWLKVTHCAVIVADHDGQVVPLAGRGLSGGLPAAASAVAQLGAHALAASLRRADLRRDARVTGACGAARGDCRSAAGDERRRARSCSIARASAGDPKLGERVAELLAAVLRGAGGGARQRADDCAAPKRCRSPTT